MNLLVALFFLHNVLATAFLGGKFFSQKDKVLKSFGIALLLNCVAFAIWSFSVLTKPSDLTMYVTLGVVFFIAALVFLLNTGVQNLKSDTRWMVLLVGGLLAVVLFFLRTFVYPSNATFSPEGFFFFNVHPLMQMFYIFGLVITSLPAIYAVASKFRSYYADLMRFCFPIEVAGGIILITTTDTQVLYLTGWIMGIAYFALWAPLLFSKKAWVAD
jgi:hypothetical protein